MGPAVRLFIDTEFNGFDGELMSMALVPQWPELSPFYEELIIKEQYDPWVKENVVPLMDGTPVYYTEFQKRLTDYLSLYDPAEIIIVADWPDDVKYKT
jgi:hypothetical protein